MEVLGLHLIETFENMFGMEKMKMFSLAMLSGYLSVYIRPVRFTRVLVA